MSYEIRIDVTGDSDELKPVETDLEKMNIKTELRKNVWIESKKIAVITCWNT